MSAPEPMLESLRAALAFERLGAPAGNVTVGRATLDGRPVRMALIENRAASGSIGVAEAERLIALFKVAATERAPLVLFIDSAGAKVSEGLGALGAFRALFRSGLEAALAGVPMAAALGRNCFGGASMLAHLAGQRLFGPTTRMAMSGPAILASSAGVSPLDEAFRAMADAALAPASRAAASPANTEWSAETDVLSWLRSALRAPGDPAAALRARHDNLAVRIARRPPDAPWEALHRRDLERLYAAGFEGGESQGLIAGRGTRAGQEERFVGIVGNAPLGTARAWRFAESVWQLTVAPPPRLEVFLDCAAHAPDLEDEKVVLTEFVVDMSFALAVLAARGTRIGLTVLGKAGGGVYVALAAPARHVASVHGANIQVLPGAAVAAILGETREATAAFDDYRASGVADEEIRLGLVPGAK